MWYPLFRAFLRSIVLTHTTQEGRDLRRGHVAVSCDERTDSFFSLISLTPASGKMLLQLLFTFCQAWWGHYVLKTVLKVVQRQKILVSSDKDYNDKIFTFIFYISQNVLERYEREGKYTLSPQNRILDHCCICLHISETSIFLSKIWKKIHSLKIVFFLNESICQTLAQVSWQRWEEKKISSESVSCRHIPACSPSLIRGMKRFSFLRLSWIPSELPSQICMPHVRNEPGKGDHV